VPTDGEEGKTAMMKIDNSIPAAENTDFLKGMTMMIAVSSGKENLSKLEKWMLIEACEKQNVMPKEMYDAFWKAYSDPYVPKTGIEFKHLWKHIEKDRYGEEGKLFTYEKMLQYCDRNSCTTDIFEIIPDETDNQDRPKWALK
jgi:hypothetical protein